MDVTFLGTGAAFNPEMDNSNACFMVGDEFFLLDCGESTFGRIWNLPELHRAARITVVVTHLHCDHVGSLGSLVSYSRYVLGTPIIVVHPLYTIVELLDLMGIERTNYRYLSAYPAHDGVSFEPVEVEHVENMRCFGYLVHTPNLNFYFSGDAIRIPQRVIEEFRNGNIDQIYQDTGIELSEHPTHGSLNYLEQLFDREERKRVFCIHMDRDYRDILREKGFGVVVTLPVDR
jgi:ribonuclease BN (tRNA processing enzyme)